MKTMEGEEAKEAAGKKLDGFAGGYGSLVFFEDGKIIDEMYEKMPK